MLMHRICTQGLYRHRKRVCTGSWLSGGEIPRCTRDSNPHQYCAWLLCRTLYQLSHPCPWQLVKKNKRTRRKRTKTRWARTRRKTATRKQSLEKQKAGRPRPASWRNAHGFCNVWEDTACGTGWGCSCPASGSQTPCSSVTLTSSPRLPSGRDGLLEHRIDWFLILKAQTWPVCSNTERIELYKSAQMQRE